MVIGSILSLIVATALTVRTSAGRPVHPTDIHRPSRWSQTQAPVFEMASGLPASTNGVEWR